MPPTSVLIPVRNAAATIVEALESVASQTFDDFECVIVDDGSTDSTPTIIGEFAGRDSRFKIFRRPAYGMVQSLNFGLEQCRGELIARMDADDICRPERFEKQVAYLMSRRKRDIAAVGCLVRVIPPPATSSGMFHYEQWVNSLTDPDDIAREIYIESPLPHPGMMIRRNALETLGGWREFDGPEDYDLWLRMISDGMKISKVPQTLLDWRDAPDRASRSDPRYSLEAFVALKAHYMSRDPRLSSGKVQIWGAGRTGKTYAKALAAKNMEIVRFIDINPRKIGRTAAGAPVVSPAELHRYRDDFIIGAVGGRGARSAREEIRTALQKMGFTEGEQFLFVA